MHPSRRLVVLGDTASLLGLVALVAACAASPGDIVGRRGAALVNGVSDPGHPAVGMLYTENSASCTATLVGSKTVLTAAHCVTDDNSPPFTLLQPVHFKVGGVKHESTSQVVHPQYDGWDCEADVAVVRLAAPVPGIIPALAATDPPVKDEAITIVGYGYTGGHTGFGTKRKAENVISDLSPTEFGYAPGEDLAILCGGDSGGPTFATRGGVELLIGVHSYALDAQGDCTGPSYDKRVDAYHAWIAQEAGGDLSLEPAEDAPPTVAIVSPADGARVPPSFPVETTATDDTGVARVELHLDGSLYADTASSPYRFQVQALADGPHTLRAEAVDQGGKRASTTVTVTVGSEETPRGDGGGGGETGSQGVDDGGGCGVTPVPAASSTGTLLLLGVVLLLRMRGRRP